MTQPQEKLSNYFQVNRGMLHSERWLNEPFTRGQAWVDLFGLAQFKDSYIRVRGIRVDVKRGQLAYSQLTLGKRWKWSRNKVRRYLSELEKDGDIEQQNNEVTSLITVKNYNEWQLGDTADDTTEGQQKDNRRDTYKNVKNVKKVKNVKNKEESIALIPATASAVAEPNDINKVMEAFQMKLNPLINYGNKTQRAAAQYLVEQLGLEKTLRTIDFAAQVKDDPYAPTITTPYQLKEKMAALVNHFRKSSSRAAVMQPINLDTI